MAMKRLPMALFLFVAFVLVNVNPEVLAAPTDLTPTDINGPKLEPRAEEAGAYSVNTRTGSAGYTYTFNLPPARGVAPELALTYSGSGPIRGEVAEGWSLTP